MRNVQKKKEKKQPKKIVQFFSRFLENLANQYRGLDQHPFYKIVKYQLRCASSDEDPESIESVKNLVNRSLL